ncbi:hypothetical protein [Clostridium kluyveri]|uniref:hypothetical protein n=1 Tax=Clostridium kluyveri TaxID=1534 RepID=UPI002245E906|nr:hypothetical protein [Clostridium kluyveri]UZQ51228.1 hypothetical protein OP486_03360 [Clostridium kluyveri]
MKDFRVLKFLDKFQGVFEKYGIDYIVMRRILQMKLLMDGRRVPTILKNSSKKKSENENNLKKSLLFYVIIGIIMVPFVVMDKNFMFQMSFVFGILMFMIMTSLISDFSSVLLDIRDKNIISSKPVHNETLSTAKIIHVCIYMFLITISISGTALAAALIKQGFLFFLIFLIEIILSNLFIVIITALLYLVILKFFDGEKLKDIINYVQIILSITITLGYQFIGRLFNIVDLKPILTSKWWQYFLPPVWFSAPFELILNHNYSYFIVIFAALALIVPIVSIIIYVKLIPTFEKNLQKLNNNGVQGKKIKGKLSIALSSIICSNREEKIFFKFASYMMKNEREFKLKVYPSLGFSLIFPFIFIFNSIGYESLSNIASSKMYLNLYFCTLILPSVIMMMKYSVNYRGAWIYKTMPIENTASIFKGTLKAFIVKLMLPVYVLESILFVFIFGIRIIPDIFVLLFNILLFTVICFKLMKKSLPFSEKLQTSAQGEGLILIVLMILLGALAGIHYFCTFISYGIYVYLIILIILVTVLWKKAFNVSL